MSKRMKQGGLLLLGISYVLLVAWVGVRAASSSDDDKITIRIAHWQIELGPPDGIQAAIDRYEEIHPDIEVEQMLVPSSIYRQWLRANFAGNNAPDIVEYGSWLAGLSDLPVRYFDPLTEDLLKPNPYNKGTGLEGVPWLRTFSDELLAQRLNSPEPGQYYAVTLTRHAMRLFVNRNLLREATGSSAPIKNFEAMRGVFRQIKAYGQREERLIVPLAGSRDNAIWTMGFYTRGVVNGLSKSLDDFGFLGMYPWQIQWKYLNGEWSYQEPELKAAFRLLAELDEQMRPGYMGFLRDVAVRQFLRGEAVFLFAGTWEASSLRRLADFPVDAWHCPQPDKNDPVVGQYMLGHFADGGVTTGFGLYLNKGTKHREQAVDFLQFLTSYEGNKLFTDKSGWLPSIKTVPVAPEIRSFISKENGYVFGGPNINLGGSTASVFQKDLYLLTGPEGNVDRFAAALDRDMPGAMRQALAGVGRAARWAMLPQDARILALGGLLGEGGRDGESLLRQQRLEAAQNLSEARALMIARQLELSADQE